MSTVQHTKPRFANQSIADESGRPGTVRSKVGCEAIDEPCTNSTAGLLSGEPTNFSHRNRRTSPLWGQCSTPVTWAAAVACAVMRILETCVDDGGARAMRQSILAPVSLTTLAHR